MPLRTVKRQTIQNLRDELIETGHSRALDAKIVSTLFGLPIAQVSSKKVAVSQRAYLHEESVWVFTNNRPFQTTLIEDDSVHSEVIATETFLSDNFEQQGLFEEAPWYTSDICAAIQLERSLFKLDFVISICEQHVICENDPHDITRLWNVTLKKADDNTRVERTHVSLAVGIVLCAFDILVKSNDDVLTFNLGRP